MLCTALQHTNHFTPTEAIHSRDTCLFGCSLELAWPTAYVTWTRKTGQECLGGRPDQNFPRFRFFRKAGRPFNVILWQCTMLAACSHFRKHSCEKWKINKNYCPLESNYNSDRGQQIDCCYLGSGESCLQHRAELYRPLFCNIWHVSHLTRSIFTFQNR